jgi:hydroxyacylglutathione hydrolase
MRPPILKTEKNSIVAEAYPIGALESNCTLIYSTDTNEAIIVDPGNSYPEIMEIVKEKKLKVVKLIHTHAHFDHIGQTKNIRETTGAKTYLHRNDLSVYEGLNEQSQLFGVEVADPGPVDELLTEDEYFSFDNGPEKLFKVIHTPGHSPGHVCFYSDYFDPPLLIAGDLIFKGSIGRTDLPGGSFEELMDAIKSKIFKLPNETQIITGHGPATILADEKQFNPFLKESFF